MPVLKGRQAESAVKQAIVLDMGDLRRQAVRIIADAQARAQQIVDAAGLRQQELLESGRVEAAAAGREEGRQQGLAEGRREGREEALAEAREQLERIQKSWLEAARHWEQQRAAMGRDAQRAVLDFALAMTRKIIHRVLELDRQVAVDQVSAALAHVLRPLDLTIRIDPADREPVEQALPRLVAQIASLEHVRLVDDPAVGRGGCVIDYAQGRIDATVQTQLDRIVELLIPEPCPGPEPASAHPQAR